MLRLTGYYYWGLSSFYFIIFLYHIVIISSVLISWLGVSNQISRPKCPLTVINIHTLIFQVNSQRLAHLSKESSILIQQQISHHKNLSIGSSSIFSLSSRDKSDLNDFQRWDEGWFDWNKNKSIAIWRVR